MEAFLIAIDPRLSALRQPDVGWMSLHGFPVEVAFIQDTVSMGKLREINFIRQILKSGKVFFETRSIKR